MWQEQDNGVRRAIPRTAVSRNNWHAIPADADPPGWPSLSVSVVIPAYNCSQTLPYTLAALAHQDYPSQLLEVIVADDGTAPPLALPPVRPERTRLVRATSGWGRANACHTGVLASEGEVVLFLDSDMVAFAGHVREQVRWHHRADDLVTIGHKVFVPAWEHVTLADTVAAAENGTLSDLYAGTPTEPHWIEQVIADTDELTSASHTAFRVFVGATGAMRRTLYDAAGGMDTALRLGEDTELGYRLAQRGAVFVPVPSSSSWHLGPPTVLTRGEQSRRWNRAFLANRMPYPRGLRQPTGRAWPVPLIRAVVTAGPDLETTRACVDRLLTGDEEDLQVDLVGDWGRLRDDRRDVLGDPLADLHLLQEWYRAEPRVRLVSEAPASVFPAAFRLDLPPTVGVGRSTVRRLLTAATRHELGVVHALPPEHGREESLTLTRTAALERARRLGAEDDHALDAVWGMRWLDGAVLGVVDLRDSRELVAAVRWGRNTSKLRRRIRRQKRALVQLRRRLRAESGKGRRPLVGRRPERRRPTSTVAN